MSIYYEMKHETVNLVFETYFSNHCFIGLTYLVSKTISALKALKTNQLLKSHIYCFQQQI